MTDRERRKKRCTGGSRTKYRPTGDGISGTRRSFWHWAAKLQRRSEPSTTTGLGRSRCCWSSDCWFGEENREMQSSDCLELLREGMHAEC